MNGTGSFSEAFDREVRRDPAKRSEVAEFLGVSGSYLNFLRRGLRKPSRRVLLLAVARYPDLAVFLEGDNAGSGCSRDDLSVGTPST